MEKERLYQVAPGGLIKGIVPPEGFRGIPQGTGSNVRIQASGGAYIVARREYLILMPEPKEKEKPGDA